MSGIGIVGVKSSTKSIVAALLSQTNDKMAFIRSPEALLYKQLTGEDAPKDIMGYLDVYLDFLKAMDDRYSKYEFFVTDYTPIDMMVDIKSFLASFRHTLKEEEVLKAMEIDLECVRVANLHFNCVILCNPAEGLPILSDFALNINHLFYNGIMSAQNQGLMMHRSALSNKITDIHQQVEQVKNFINCLGQSLMREKENYFIH